MKAYFYIAAALLPALLISCHKKSESLPDEVLTVDVAQPTVDSIVLHKTYPGVLTANRQVEVVARVNGTLSSKNYTSGDRVPSGAVLFTIESSSYRDAVSRARASLETAVAQQAYAASHYEALQRALQTQAVSRMEAEQGRSALESANAAVETARADLNTANTNLGYCTVRAPFTGHITASALDVGSYVSGAGAPVTLATIYEDDVMIANFSIEDGAFLPMIGGVLAAEGIDYHAIPVAFSDTLGHSYTASLDYMSPAVDTSTGTVSLQATINNPYNELRSGMYVSVDLPSGVAPHAVLVRTSAISRDQRGSYLYTVNDSSKVVYSPVTLGQAVGDSLTIVTEGITPADRYVTRALLKVRPGMKVNARLTE